MFGRGKTRGGFAPHSRVRSSDQAQSIRPQLSLLPISPQSSPFRLGRGASRAGFGVSSATAPRPPPSTLIDDGDTSLPSMVEGLQLEGLPQETARTLCPGTAGRAIRLRANFFPVHLEKKLKVFQYDIQFSDQRKDSEGLEAASQERFLKYHAPTLLAAFVKNNSEGLFAKIRYTYDSFHSIYTVQKLPLCMPYNQVVELNANRRVYAFTVQLRLVSEFDLNHINSFLGQQQTTSVLDIVVGNVLQEYFKSWQREWFELSRARSVVQAPLVHFVPGFVPSVRLTRSGLALNIHLKTACLLSPTFQRLSDLVFALTRQHGPELNARSIHYPDVNQVIRGLKIFTTHRGCKTVYTVDFLDTKTPADVRFEKNGSIMLLREYFASVYKINVHEWPLVRTRNRCYLPLELCYLVDSQFLANSRLDQSTQRQLLLNSTHEPSRYFDQVHGYASKITSSHPLLAEFGVRVDPVCVQLKGRVLDAPQLDCPGPNDLLSRPMTLTTWALFSLDPYARQADLEQFATRMTIMGKRLGFQVSPAAVIAVLNVRRLNEIGNIFNHLHEKLPDCQIAMFAIPRVSPLGPSKMYNTIKTYGDVQCQVMTQCFKADYIARQPPGYFNDLLLKINGKLDGANCLALAHYLNRVPKIDLNRTMVVGIDVNHPSNGERVHCSVAAAVASTDATLTHYITSVQVQQHDRQEVICVQVMRRLMCDLLEQYVKINGGRWPCSVIIFRDGLSEGQLEACRGTEVATIREVITELAGTAPSLTVMVTQKRHHTRFGPVQPWRRQCNRETLNPPPGTVVDDGIVEPHFDVFYLNSHFSALGTSRPTKYILVRDDHHFESDDLQHLCYFLCHQSIRFRGSLSIPTVVRYADLAAYRAKMHLEAHHQLVDTASPRQMEAAATRDYNYWIKCNDTIRRKLYFC